MAGSSAPPGFRTEDRFSLTPHPEQVAENRGMVDMSSSQPGRRNTPRAVADGAPASTATAPRVGQRAETTRPRRSSAARPAPAPGALFHQPPMCEKPAIAVREALLLVHHHRSVWASSSSRCPPRQSIMDEKGVQRLLQPVVGAQQSIPSVIPRPIAPINPARSAASGSGRLGWDRRPARSAAERSLAGQIIIIAQCPRLPRELLCRHGFKIARGRRHRFDRLCGQRRRKQRGECEERANGDNPRNGAAVWPPAIACISHDAIQPPGARHPSGRRPPRLRWRAASRGWWWSAAARSSVRIS